MRWRWWCFALVLFASSAAADIFHVAPPPAGSDLHDGGPGQPWATLQHAADSVQAGDAVIVHAGAYVGMHITTSGAPGSPIEFRVADGEYEAGGRIFQDGFESSDAGGVSPPAWLFLL
jgi:hypothetical protein